VEITDKFRDDATARALLERIKDAAKGGELSFMEVCGTHTVALFRSGIREALRGSVKMVSGPGCPVCVTPNDYLDRAIAISKRGDAIIVTFGDMMRVPGSSSSLAAEKARGADVRVVYTPLDALKIAAENPAKKVVFPAVGFETTVPAIALTVKKARTADLKNAYFLVSHKLVPPALRALLDSGETKLSGLLLPGHVSAIIGASAYGFLRDEYRVPGAVAGFELVDILYGILKLAEMAASGKPDIFNAYTRAVKENGNPDAVKIIYDVFEVADAKWRGIGVIPGSGLKLRPEYSRHDASGIDADVEKTVEPKGCLCGHVLRGVKTPPDCPLFGKKCTPENPVGSCMVSSEGTCAAYFKYSI
jgi:hydrogenase expression/formation protein HypD